MYQHFYWPLISMPALTVILSANFFSLFLAFLEEGALVRLKCADLPYRDFDAPVLGFQYVVGGLHQQVTFTAANRSDRTRRDAAVNQEIANRFGTLK